ncbi:MAG: hypothetical protein GQ552_05005 [Flavobacteriaceae bacterium]|nr:hypothetical protein [Flavobacteriaceae bacterium]
MKKLLSFTIMFILFISISLAQNVEPEFEKQDNLTKATYYFDNGDIKETGFFKNEKLQGKWITYNQEGKITAIANYENGKKEGKWYVISNDTIKELIYKSNKLIEVKNKKGTELSLI